MNIQIVTSLKEHIPAFKNIEYICFGKQWTCTQFDRELDNPACHYFTTLDEETVIGYVGYWKILQEAHITSLAVHPNYQNRHIAHLLMFHLLDDCIQNDINWITLEVKESNVKAQHLYKNFGFAVLGRRKNYYQADLQDALVMWTEDIHSLEYQHLLHSLKQKSLNLVSNLG